MAARVLTVAQAIPRGPQATLAARYEAGVEQMPL